MHVYLIYYENLIEPVAGRPPRLMDCYSRFNDAVDEIERRARGTRDKLSKQSKMEFTVQTVVSDINCQAQTTVSNPEGAGIEAWYVEERKVK